MNFDITEEQQMLQETIRQLLERECPPTRLREIFEGESGHDPALWKHMVEMGLAGLVAPEAYGGAGLEMLDLALAAETPRARQRAEQRKGENSVVVRREVRCISRPHSVEGLLPISPRRFQRTRAAGRHPI